MEENKETEAENKEKTEKKQGTKRKSTGTSKKASTSNTKTTAKTTATKKNVAKKSTVAKTTTKKADSATKVSSAKTPRKVTEAKKTTSTKEKDINVIDEKASVIEEEKPEVKVEKNSKEVKEIEKEEKKPNDIKVENDKKQEKSEGKVEKKQEDSKHEENGKDKKVKKHKVLRTILLIIVVLLILFSIHFYRNYKIINELLSKMKVIENTSNYSYRTEYYTTNDTNQRDFLEHYYKDDKMILVKNSDDGKIIIWYDRLSGESVFLSPQTLTATIKNEVELDSLYDTKPLGGLYYAEKCTRGLDFLYLITQDTVNGQECYKINWLGQICWYNKENGLLVKSLNSKTIIDGKEYDSITEWKNWEIGNLTDEDVSKPNLIGYTVNRAD